MIDIILDTLIDSIKMLPFLYLSYLIIEFVEHKSSQKIKNALSKSGKYGPFVGSILGCFPQCGFSVTAASLYSGRVITLGTLIAVFLTTSDEAIPVLLSNPGNAGKLVKLIITKFLIGIIFGFIIDFFLRRKNKIKSQTQVVDTEEHIHHMCSSDHCDCENENIFLSSLKHTLNIFLFILIVAFILNTAIYFIGQDNLSKVLMTGSIFQPIVAGLIGIIPNCAASVLLTELYLAGNISFASVIAGLSTGAGIGFVVLFKENKNVKENLKILGLVYSIGVISGIIIEIIGLVIK